MRLSAFKVSLTAYGVTVIDVEPNAAISDRATTPQSSASLNLEIFKAGSKIAKYR